MRKLRRKERRGFPQGHQQVSHRTRMGRKAPGSLLQGPPVSWWLELPNQRWRRWCSLQGLTTSQRQRAPSVGSSASQGTRACGVGKKAKSTAPWTPDGPSREPARHERDHLLSVPAPADPLLLLGDPRADSHCAPALRVPQGSLGHQRTAPWEKLGGELG